MYEFASRIRYSETDGQGVLTLQSLIDYFQDCSIFQTQDAGAGIGYLKEQGLIWVLNSWQIDIARMPHLYESVRTGTIPYLLKGFAGHRNFYMKTEAGEMCAAANSVWVLMDVRTMYPARITPEHASRYTLGKKLDMVYLDRKIALPAQEGTAGKEIMVHRHHLDSNGHVNNGQYVRMALESLEDLTEHKETPETSLRMRTIRRLRAEYKRQTHLGDMLTPVVHWYGDAAEDMPFCAVDLRTGDASCCVVELS